MEEHKDKKLEIEIIINGTSYSKMLFPEGINLTGLRDQVLDKTKNTGQPSENWEVKNSNGDLLDLKKHLRDYENLDQIWFTLKAGIGGQ